MSDDRKKIVMARREAVQRLRPYVRAVLEAVGHPEAWVTDQSQVGDFFFGLTDEEAASRCDEIARRLGVDSVGAGDYVRDLAAYLWRRDGSEEGKDGG